jgi:hypothetical protein
LITGASASTTEEENKLPVLTNVRRVSEKNPETTYPFQGYVFKAHAEHDYANRRHRGVVKLWVAAEKYGFIRVENSDREAYFKSNQVFFFFVFLIFFFFSNGILDNESLSIWLSILLLIPKIATSLAV